MHRQVGFKRLLISQIESEEAREKTVSIGTYAQICDHSLVLSSQSISHRIRRDDRGPYLLEVQTSDAERAEEQIALYKKENPEQKENPPLAIRFELSPLLVLLVPVAFTLLQFSRYGSRFYHTGISDAEKILSGDWWRPVTALTLHGDAHHLVSNLVSGYIILNLLAFRMPLSRIAFPLAVASAIANFLVAATVQSDFRSLGFSTFVFCALGALCTVEFRLLPKSSSTTLRRFAPLGAAFLLATFLGIGEHSDILAHFYGLVLGLAVGFVPRKKHLLWGSPFSARDVLLWILYFALFIFAWRRAILLSL